MSLVLAVGAVLSGCGAEGGHRATSGGKAAWSFTDDRGVRVSLKAHPTRIVAYELAVAPLWYLGVKPVGVFAYEALDTTPVLQGVDVKGMTVVGRAYGQINLEQLAALKPDLVVTIFDPRMTGPAVGFADKNMQAKVQAIAPVVAMDMTKDWSATTKRFEELAQALGANLQAPGLVAARMRLDTAVAGLRAAAARKPGLRVLTVGAYTGAGLAVMRPENFPDLLQYRQWGLDMVEPAGKPADINTNYNGFLAEHFSFEQADAYPADIILYDDRPFAMSLKDLAKISTWRTRPAVKAGQLVPWRQQQTWTYQLRAQDVEALTRMLNRARKVT